MLLGCYTALGNPAATKRVARIAFDRAERAVIQDQSNGGAMAGAAQGLAALGEAERAMEWMKRARLVDPDNWVMNYNFVCALSIYLNQPEAALDLLGSILPKASAAFVAHMQIDPELDPIRDHPRFKDMLADAELRVAAQESQAKS